jgi:hypothetical protein
MLINWGVRQDPTTSRSEYRIKEVLREELDDDGRWGHFVERHNKKLKGKKKEMGAKRFRDRRQTQIKQEEEKTRELLKKH